MSKKTNLFPLTILGIIILLAGGISASALEGSSDHNAASSPESQVVMGNEVALIETTSTILGDILTDLGVPYDYFSTSSFCSVDLSPYSTVVIGMDGGSIETADVGCVANWAKQGGGLLMIGGSNYTPFATGVNANLFSIDTTNHSWTRVSGAPHFTKTRRLLTWGLPETYNFANISATFYMIRTLGGIFPVAINGDDQKAFMVKRLGAGRLVYFINSPLASYWQDNNDFNILRKIVRNSLWVVTSSEVNLTFEAPSISTTTKLSQTWANLKANP